MYRRLLLVLILSFVSVIPSLGQGPQQVDIGRKQIIVTRIMDPVIAVEKAAPDLIELTNPTGQLYVFFPEPDLKKLGLANLIVNMTLSHSSAIYRPTVLENGHLMRIDLPSINPPGDDGNIRNLERVITVVNNYFDPYFHQLSREDFTEEIVVTENVTTKDNFGRPQTKPTQVKKKITKSRVVSRPGRSLNQESFKTLISGTGLQAPIVHESFLLHCLDTLDTSLSIEGFNRGIYYKLRGYDKLSQKEFLDLFGASEAASEALDSNDFVGKWFSGVTAKPRRGIALYGRGVKPTAGLPLVTITQDGKDGRTNSSASNHPIYNLLKFKFAATEIIAVLPNGLPAGALFDADGVVQISVPDTVAKDHTIPAPFTANLRPWISCARCHAPDDMFKPFRNDVQLMLGSEDADGNIKLTKDNLRFNIFGDLSVEDQAKAIDELTSKYGGDLEDTFVLARNAQERLTFRLTNGMTTAAAWTAISKWYEDYFYQTVSPRRACYDLGYKVDPTATADECAAVFATVIPKIPVNALGVHPEDFGIAALRTFDSKKRPYQIVVADWERVYQDALFRSYAAELDRAAELKGKEPKK